MELKEIRMKFLQIRVGFYLFFSPHLLSEESETGLNMICAITVLRWKEGRKEGRKTKDGRWKTEDGRRKKEERREKAGRKRGERGEKKGRKKGEIREEEERRRNWFTSNVAESISTNLEFYRFFRDSSLIGCEFPKKAKRIHRIY